ncbi:hypothetical protein DPMN_112295 [Dreissena polymorpha]|uniref:Uncharacterized protein n=1 Tax=Dreissena polymorpha TaxID=45954 RepID=A0A9D4KG35_DREPO|nr:hypothetical protein DPMN_112295 [Dreissena polymorpha]
MVGDRVGYNDSDYDGASNSDVSTYKDFLENISSYEDVQDFDIVCPSSVIEISLDYEEIAVVPSELKPLHQVHTVTFTKKTMFLCDTFVGRSHTVDYFEIFK